jgi:hypothetical protein
MALKMFKAQDEFLEGYPDFPSSRPERPINTSGAIFFGEATDIRHSRIRGIFYLTNFSAGVEGP